MKGSQLVITIMRSKIMRIIILVFCIVLGIGIVRSVYMLSQKKTVMAERLVALSDLQTKNKSLTENLKEATSPAFIEREARDKLGLVREGETVVIMDKSGLSALGNTNQQQQQVPLWKQWWVLFF